MNPYASQSSLECEVLQADSIGLIRLLYRGALESIKRAKEALAAGDTAERSRHISRSSEILAELMLSVDRQHGGELAANLIELYDYILHLIMQAHAEQQDKPLTEAASLLQTLLEAWDTIAQPTAPPPMETTQIPVASYY
jgi:flagellar protein FliS